MMKATVFFARPAPSEPDGPPAVHHAYWLVASDVEYVRRAVASIVPLNVDTPLPSAVHILADSYGERKALEQALEIVKNLPPNEGLTMRIDGPS